MATTSSRDGGIVGVVWQSSATGGEAVVGDSTQLTPLGQATSTKSGIYGFTGASATTLGSHGNGSLRVFPCVFPNAATLSRIGAEVTSAGEAGSLVRLGIYRDTGEFYPGALVLDAGTIDGTSVAIQEITISQALSPGVYWVGAAVQAAPTTQPTVRAISSAPFSCGSSGNSSNPNATLGYVQTGVTGALPSTFTTTPSSSGAGCRVFWKVA